eukprot:Amastigsp_a842161_15.p3 type:complete len:160 gc:universal Amastigsp_a842161_15:777-1256(+)
MRTAGSCAPSQGSRHRPGRCTKRASKRRLSVRAPVSSRQLARSAATMRRSSAAMRRSRRRLQRLHLETRGPQLVGAIVSTKKSSTETSASPRSLSLLALSATPRRFSSCALALCPQSCRRRSKTSHRRGPDRSRSTLSFLCSSSPQPGCGWGRRWLQAS